MPTFWAMMYTISSVSKSNLSKGTQSLRTDLVLGPKHFEFIFPLSLGSMLRTKKERLDWLYINDPDNEYSEEMSMKELKAAVMYVVSKKK